MDRNWLIWQLADSAFPTGGFAHSAGFEAALQWGEDPPHNLGICEDDAEPVVTVVAQAFQHWLGGMLHAHAISSPGTAWTSALPG